MAAVKVLYDTLEIDVTPDYLFKEFFLLIAHKYKDCALLKSKFVAVNRKSAEKVHNF